MPRDEESQDNTELSPAAELESQLYGKNYTAEISCLFPVEGEVESFSFTAHQKFNDSIGNIKELEDSVQYGGEAVEGLKGELSSIEIEFPATAATEQKPILLERVPRAKGSAEKIRERVNIIKAAIEQNIKKNGISNVFVKNLDAISHFAHYAALDSFLQQMATGKCEVKEQNITVGSNLLNGVTNKIKIFPIENDTLTLHFLHEYALQALPSSDFPLVVFNDRLLQTNTIVKYNLKDAPKEKFILEQTNKLVHTNVELNQELIGSRESAIAASSFNRFFLMKKLQKIAQNDSGRLLYSNGKCSDAVPSDIAAILEYFWDIPSELVSEHTSSSVDAVISSEQSKQTLEFIRHIHRGDYFDKEITFTWIQPNESAANDASKSPSSGKVIFNPNDFFDPKPSAENMQGGVKIMITGEDPQELDYGASMGLSGELIPLKWEGLLEGQTNPVAVDKDLAKDFPVINRDEGTAKNIQERVEKTRAKILAIPNINISDERLAEMSHFVHSFATSSMSNFKRGVGPYTINGRMINFSSEFPSKADNKRLADGEANFDRNTAVKVLSCDKDYVTFQFSQDQIIISRDISGENNYCANDYVLRNAAIVKYPRTTSSKISVTRLNEIVARDIFAGTDYQNDSSDVPSVPFKKLISTSAGAKAEEVIICTLQSPSADPDNDNIIGLEISRPGKNKSKVTHKIFYETSSSEGINKSQDDLSNQLDKLSWISENSPVVVSPNISRSEGAKQFISDRVGWVKDQILANSKDISAEQLIPMSHFVHYFATAVTSDFKQPTNQEIAALTQPLSLALSTIKQSKRSKLRTISPTISLSGAFPAPKDQKAGEGIEPFDRKISIKLIAQDQNHLTFEFSNDALIQKIGFDRSCCSDHVLRSIGVVKYPIAATLSQDILVTSKHQIVERNVFEGTSYAGNSRIPSFTWKSSALKLKPQPKPESKKFISSLTMTILFTQPLLDLGLTKIEQIPEVQDLFEGDLQYIFDLAEGVAFLLGAAAVGYTLAPQKTAVSRLFSIGIAVSLAGILQVSELEADIAHLAQMVTLLCIGMFAFAYAIRQDNLAANIASQPGFAKTLAIASVALLIGGMGIAFLGVEECNPGEWWDAGQAFCESTLGADVLKSSVGAAGGGLLLFKSMSQEAPSKQSNSTSSKSSGNSSTAG